MERLHAGSIFLDKDYRTPVQCLERLQNEVQYSSADLSSFVTASLVSLRRMGLTHELALPIVEKALVDHLWSLLKSFASADEIVSEL